MNLKQLKMNKINPNKQKKKITVKKWHRKYECNKEEKNNTKVWFFEKT